MPLETQPGNEHRGELVIVATPLGNLGDITRRALEVLESADVVFCEDTRHSRTIFSAYSLRSRQRLRALHEHNEAGLCEEIVALVRAGQRVAVVTDAGTPTISDPGARVAAAVAAAGLRVTTAPGPSSVVAALSVSGLDTERFVMEGFLPRRGGERRVVFEGWAREPRTVVFFESPQRLATSLTELAALYPGRRVAVVRELTKVHEEVLRGTVFEVADSLSRREVLGEVVVVVEGGAATPVDDATVRAALADHLAGGASVRDAANAVAADLGVAHRDAYRAALALRAGEDHPSDQ